MSQRHLLALFDNFDEAGAAIAELRATPIRGFSMDDLILKSPIEHPEVERVLGDKPAIEFNREKMEKFAPQLKKTYYDAAKFKTYLEQLGITYPTLLK